jgi:hypothetical protein
MLLIYSKKESGKIKFLTSLEVEPINITHKLSLQLILGGGGGAERRSDVAGGGTEINQVIFSFNIGVYLELRSQNLAEEEAGEASLPLHIDNRRSYRHLNMKNY